MMLNSNFQALQKQLILQLKPNTNRIIIRRGNILEDAMREINRHNFDPFGKLEVSLFIA